jgi:hypothetical protein
VTGSSAYMARVRKERLSAALCPDCGKRPPLAGRTRCVPCLRHASEHQLRRKLDARAEGRCHACGEEVRVPTLCGDCADKKRNRNTKRALESERERVPTKIDLKSLVGTHIRNRQLGQVLAALLLLRRGRWGVKELATELEMHWRTTYRMLVSLERAGVKMAKTKDGAHAYWTIPAEPLRKLLLL